MLGIRTGAKSIAKCLFSGHYVKLITLCALLAAGRGLGQGTPERFFLSHSPSWSSGEEF